MTYPKITLKPKSWPEDSTIELDYEEAKEIWEQLNVIFKLKQINTVYSSFGSASRKDAEMHFQIKDFTGGP